MIKKISLRNFKSIRRCTLSLDALNILVGPNGSGKSNCLDALKFVRDALDGSLEQAIRVRGGFHVMRHLMAAPDGVVGVELDLILGGESTAWSVEIEGAERGFKVKKERAQRGASWFEVENGLVKTNAPHPMPPASEDRLYLVNAAGLDTFRPIYDALRGMGFYHLNPEHIRRPQPPSSGDVLDDEGRELANVIERMTRTQGTNILERIEDYLGHLVAGIKHVRAKNIAHLVGLEFEQTLGHEGETKTFPASSMSDGTLRGLGVLVALFQGVAGKKFSLVGIEEPEIALHPAGVGLLRDALIEASQHIQVIVTTHSADLLDSAELPSESIFAVYQEDGATHIDSLDQASKIALASKMYTAGELLRMDQLRPAQGGEP